MYDTARVRDSSNDNNKKKCDDVCSCTYVCVRRVKVLYVLASTNVFKFKSVLTVGHHAYTWPVFCTMRKGQQQQQQQKR